MKELTSVWRVFATSTWTRIYHLSTNGEVIDVGDRHYITAFPLRSRLCSPNLVRDGIPFSQTFYLEKDNINYAFRTPIETYTTMLTSTLDDHDITFTSIIVSPAAHIVRFIELLPNPVAAPTNALQPSGQSRDPLPDETVH